MQDLCDQSMSDDFGILLATWRKRAHLNQSQLAGEVLVSRGTISDWERGVRIPDQRDLERLAETLCRGGDEKTQLFSAAYRHRDQHTRYDFYAYQRQPPHYVSRPALLAAV